MAFATTSSVTSFSASWEIKFSDDAPPCASKSITSARHASFNRSMRMMQLSSPNAHFRPHARTAVRRGYLSSVAGYAFSMAGFPLKFCSMAAQNSLAPAVVDTSYVSLHDRSSLTSVAVV